MLRAVLLFMLAGCQTVEECPETSPCGSCPEVAVDYNDVAIEDCEARLEKCFDRALGLEGELKICKKPKNKKKKGKK